MIYALNDQDNAKIQAKRRAHARALDSCLYVRLRAGLPPRPCARSSIKRMLLERIYVGSIFLQPNELGVNIPPSSRILQVMHLDHPRQQHTVHCISIVQNGIVRPHIPEEKVALHGSPNYLSNLDVLMRAAKLQTRRAALLNCGYQVCGQNVHGARDIEGAWTVQRGVASPAIKSAPTRRKKGKCEVGVHDVAFRVHFPVKRIAREALPNVS